MWKIKRDGKQLVITSDGKRTVRTFVTVEQAIAQHDKLVQEHAQELESRRSIRLVDPRHPELEQAIVNAPEDPGGYAVYADWLQSQGDPRGQLMALQLAPEPHSQEHARAIGREIAAHPAYYYGPLAVHRKHAVFRWQFGFIHDVNLGHIESGEPAGVLEQVLKHPSGRFLVDLTIRPRNVEPEDAQPIIDALERLAPPTLRSIHMYAKPGVDLRRLWSALPRLRVLSLVQSRCRIGALAVPELEWLRIVGHAVAEDEVTTFTRANWPMLKRIDLAKPDQLWLDELVGMFERAPHLEHLEVTGARDIAELLRVLPQTSVAARLVKLELDDNAMTDAQAIELARQRERFPRLAWISAMRNRLSASGAAAIRSMAKTAWA
jgi:uncharacterized protein (TIGR02996 family)